MKRILFTLGAVLLFCTPAAGGPNADGAIIVHVADIIYGTGDVCTTPAGQPASCEEAITRRDDSSAVVWFLAAFPPGSFPAVAAVYFGVDFDMDNLGVDGSGPCGPLGTMIIQDAGWPANDAGCSIGFGTPIEGETLFRFYYFLMNETSGSAGPYFCSGINPTGGYAAFFDNTFPPREDRVTQFGCVRWYEAGNNTCPQVMPVAVCCDPLTGHCVMTTQSGCPAPGIWHTEWDTCLPNPCPRPVAVCCQVDGSCTTGIEEDCLAPAIWHLDWTSCLPNPCPGPLAVCCAPAGSCTITPEASCQAPHVWHSEWTSCTPNLCPQHVTAPCCAADGACVILTATVCLSPAIWHPEWTTCTPNPCPAPTAACCEPDGDCTITTETACLPPNWWWDGHTTCVPNQCPQPFGACCAPNGSCLIRLEASCAPPSVWYEEWTDCSPNPCPPFLAACCNPVSGECTVVTSSECHAPLVWHPEWTICEPNPCPTPYGPNVNGAIVVHTNDAYDYLSTTVCSTPTSQPASCAEVITETDRSVRSVIWFLAAFLPGANPDVAAVYFGVDFDDVNLDASLGYGYCGPAGTIELPEAGWPSNSAGNALGFGTPISGSLLFPFYYFVVDNQSGLQGPAFCSAVNPTGGYAAFFDSGFPPAEDRVNLFGCVRWYEPGLNPCPVTPAPMGACCDPVTATCALTSWGGCPDPWVWLGEGTLCEPNSCPQPIGACCFANGECELLTQAACIAAVDHVSWLGYGSSCMPDSPCDQPGACCNLSTGTCTITHPDLCLPPLFFVGEGTACLPDGTCPQLGACCSMSGDCIYVFNTQCPPDWSWHPEWQCEPNYCPPPVPTERTTWGKIKASFR